MGLFLEALQHKLIMGSLSRFRHRQTKSIMCSCDNKIMSVFFIQFLMLRKKYALKFFGVFFWATLTLNGYWALINGTLNCACPAGIAVSLQGSAGTDNTRRTNTCVSRLRHTSCHCSHQPLPACRQGGQLSTRQHFSRGCRSHFVVLDGQRISVHSVGSVANCAVCDGTGEKHRPCGAVGKFQLAPVMDR